MSLTQHMVIFRNKVRGYTKNQCDYAVRDIHDTLRVQGGDMRDPYIEKLWAELDAVRERQHVLSRKDRDSLANRWHTRSDGQPLDTEA